MLNNGVQKNIRLRQTKVDHLQIVSLHTAECSFFLCVEVEMKKKSSA